MNEPDPLAQKIKERYGVLKGIRDPWQTLWDEIARYAMPRRVPGLNGASLTPGVSNEQQLFDTTTVQAGMTLANGQLAWMSPLEAPWFAFEPKVQFQADDEVKRWLGYATEAVRNELAVSNFYTAVHEFYWDRGVFGTAALFVDQGSKNLINAQHWPVGSFVIDEDADGLVDTVIREFELTARQAAQKFGEANCSAKLQEALKAGGNKEHEKFWFLHSIMPRGDAERDKAKLDDVNMPIASVYVERDACHVCRVSGFEEMPVMVSRYLEWGSNARGFYGWSPAWAALPEARQVNFLQKMMDALAEKMAFPPILAPEELEGEIDGNANGVTYFAAQMATSGALPKEWMTQGRYDIGLERIQERQKAIERAFHVDLFQMFAQLTKQMTAREVAERSQEKLIQFSPTFSRLTSELFNPLLERCLGILGRNGELPATEGTQYEGKPFQTQYSSRIALSLRSQPAIGWLSNLERLVAEQALSPEVVDNFDFDKATRAVAGLLGVPVDYIRPEREVATMRENRAAAMKAQEERAAAMAAVDVGSKVKADSPLANVIGAQMGVAA